uniref:Endo-1,5-alpha-L-arabinanase A n=1 Tax=Acrobeloides nanus TaxID=290746 RepID=A0A914DHA3_9BILA
MGSSTGFVKQGEQPVHLANDRPTGIEGSCLWKNGKYYYLAASLEHCCFGLQSTYRVVYDRSTNPRGPFVDKAGTNLLNGGGSELIVTHFPMIGPGNGFVYKGQPGKNRDIYAYHYYDGLNGGHARLSINYMQYTDDGWPYLY